MPSYVQTRHVPSGTPNLTESGVVPMAKLIYRNKYLFSLAVLAMMALSSGAALKWGQ
jgi:hypothetical protein